ncbi:MAG: sortase [Clostridiales bacterium]|nr:sortase [Clostridiales bacterium]
MKKTIIRIVAVAMLALMVLTALPAFAVTFYGVAAAQTPVYEKPKSSAKVLAYVTGQVTINRQDRSSGMYNITAAYGGNNVTGWVAESSISSFSKDQGSGSTGISTNTNTNTSTNTNTNTSTASGTFTATLAGGAVVYNNGKEAARVSRGGNVTVNYRNADASQVYITINTGSGSVSGWVAASYISNLRSSSSGSISLANLPTSGASAGTSAASGVKMYDTAKSAVSKDNNIYVRSTATSSTKGATKLRNMRGKTFTVLGTDSTGSFLYADYNGTRGFVRAQDFTFTSGTVVEQNTNTNTNTNTSGVTANSTGMAASGATPGVGSKSQSDVWGSITVPGTGKNYPIYGNYTNKKGNLYYYDYSNIKSYNYIHTTTAKGSQVAVVMGHNMRKSKTYFHNLHHIQNAILGKSTCDYCKASCSGYGKSISASWEGSRSWEVVAFFEVPKNKAYKNILPIMAQPWNYTTSQYLSSVASYVNTFSGKSWANTSALTDNGKYMMLITCGDKTDSSNIAKLYMLLKAVG